MGSILGILNFISELWRAISQAISLWQKAKREGWVQDGQRITDAISRAQTDEERRALLKRLADSIHNTP